jgi:hypothetical protein
LRFSPFGGCEGVDYLINDVVMRFDILYNSSTPSHPPKGENPQLKYIAAKIARVNGPMVLKYVHVFMLPMEI